MILLLRRQPGVWHYKRHDETTVWRVQHVISYGQVGNKVRLAKKEFWLKLHIHVLAVRFNVDIVACLERPICLPTLE